MSASNVLCETADDYENKRLPTLEFSFNLTEEGFLTHTYFQKPMKTPFILMERSAMGDQQKYAILSNELIRRLSTIDTEYVTVAEIMEVIEVFICEMKSSGYSREQTRNTVISGIKGWKRKVEKRRKEGVPFYRSAKSTLSGRVRKKLLERETWYQDKEKEEDNEDVPEGWRSRREKNIKLEKKEKKRISSIKAPIFMNNLSKFYCCQCLALYGIQII